MLLAVPSIIRIAFSLSLALRSFFLTSTISSNCCRVTLPTLSLLGTPDPFANQAAVLISTAAGVLLVSKEKLLSL